jgi:hypothetical protein
VDETAQDLEDLQHLLDASYEHAGTHLRSIHTPARRLGAEALVERLTGMCLLVVATVSADGRPLSGPVDGVFFRGAFHFGTDPRAVRWRHLLRNPAVSATHLPSEDWAVVVHGAASAVDVSSAGDTQLRERLLAVYTPRYGPEWEQFLDAGPVYARVDAVRMYAIDVTAAAWDP